jgi:hypothetical protein
MSWLDQQVIYSPRLTTGSPFLRALFDSPSRCGVTLSKATHPTVAQRDLSAGRAAYRNAEEGTRGAALRLIENADWIRADASPHAVYRKELPARQDGNPRLRRDYQAVREESLRQIKRQRIGRA